MNTDKKFEEIVKQALRKTIKQGKKSEDDGRCVYRSPEQGVCCIVGHCIKDEFYTFNIEGKGVKGDNETLNNIINQSFGFDLTDKQSDILITLQNCHDRTHKNNFIDMLHSNIARRVNEEYLPQYCLDVFNEVL